MPSATRDRCGRSSGAGEFAAIARANVEDFFGGPHPAWQLTVGDLAEVLETDVEPGSVDRVVLDMLAPWECLDAVARVLAPGGVLICYVATATQLSRVAEGARSHGAYTEPQAWESLVRGWHLEGLAVRPQHRMVGHTGFLVTARRMAPDVLPPLRRRRPAKGAYATETGDPAAGRVDPAVGAEPVEAPVTAADFGERQISERTLRRRVRAAGHPVEPGSG